MFKEIPATKTSISKRKLVFGIAINNADYMVNITVDKRRFCCPFYKRWNHMLERCYSESFASKNPSYKGCTACEQWLTFSNFKSWMIKQDWQGKQLDKDLVETGNKIYSPKTCLFIPQYINALLTDRRALRGAEPQGVHFNKRDNKFQANCSVNGRKKHLGYFDTPESASKEYRAFKSDLILRIASDQEQPLKGYLIRISNEYLSQ